MEKEYKITKEHCLTLIHGICNRCGGVLEPIETVDNADDPTFWPACLACNVFCYGVDPIHYEIARQLVDDKNHIAYHHVKHPVATPQTSSEIAYADYYRKTQISGTTGLVTSILSIYNKLKP